MNICLKELRRKTNVMDQSNTFETVRDDWEKYIKEFVYQLSDGQIPTLSNAEWHDEKGRVNVYPADNEGKEKRGLQGPYYRSEVALNRNAVNVIWKLFKQFSEEHGLHKVERYRENEKELDRYDFRAENDDDHFSCNIHLSGEWNQPYISLLMFVGPRYRSVDL